ncbi:hypothetical protein RHGRI_012718 [Rhododendron griersonianum]|nr:hypothetical protein RHGRI_012718 [Rhododendron griersonianum]
MNMQKTPTEECDAWRKEVVEMENKIETIKQEFNVEKKCVGGLCPDIFARIELGKQVVNMINDIDVLLEKSKFERGFLVDLPPTIVEKKPGPDSTLSTSAYNTLGMVLDKIRDESTPKIGIWGMGGVGKTTVLQLLNNTPEITAMFDHVIWVTVSKSPSIRMVQEEVLRRLQIKLDGGESDETVACRLFHELGRKKYLLLLDDVWEIVDLAVVGLPNPNKDNGCKLVLTTRNLDVCRKMGTYTVIEVKVLSKEEALEMFYTNVGDFARLPAIKELAESVVKECDGLPLALRVVSGALRNEANVNVWRNFLRELRSPSTSFIEDLNEKVFKVLKVSYDHLKTIEKKKCLLFCGLYPEDSNIKKPELIEYWKAEGILSRKLTLEEAHDKGEAILQALIDASLLEKCDERYDNHVKMHDVVRDLVLAMTSPEGGEESTHLVRAGISSEKMPEEAEWKKATRISFMDHDLRNLPESPDCPKLLTLLLQGNKNLEVIPETFFDNMPNLRVLDLSHTGIKSLPYSILKLYNLRELVLLGCMNLPALPIGILCRLSQIEVFKLAGGLSDESMYIDAKELSDLSSLSSLHFDFQRVDNLQYFLQHSRPWKRRTLTVFGLAVGQDSVMEWQIEQYKRCLSYKVSGGEETGSGLPSAIEDALNRSNCFLLKGQDKLNSLSEVGAHNTYELRYCKIEECVALENIANRNGLQTGAFPNLECLYLYDLRNLKSILCSEMEEGQLLPPAPPNLNSFTNLKTLHLVGCPRIEQIFSSGFLVQQLSNLEVLDVLDCQGLEGMVPDGEKIEYKALPKLRSLWLTYLPEFNLPIRDIAPAVATTYLGGRDGIAQIFVSHGDYINSLQFQFVENGTLVLSEKHGGRGGTGEAKFSVLMKNKQVRWNYPSEFLTGINGYHSCGRTVSLTFFAAACAQPVCKIGKCLWAPIARRINYARKLSKNWQALCKKVSELRIKRNDIVVQIYRMNMQKTPTEECDAWRTEVVEMENKIETIKQEFTVEKKCVGELCPDIFARIEHGKRVVNMINDIDVLLEKSKFERGFLVDSPPAIVEKKPGPDSTLSMSAYNTMGMVLDKIRDESTPKIGIWGMGGVGKTTVLQLLNNTPEITAMFDHVIWVTVSKSPSIRMVQEEVVRRLKIKLDGGESDETVASRLFHELDRKKYLLLLDDVWEMVDLAVVGLPNPNKDNGCKLVLTTRNLEVCRKMGTYTEIKVKVLSEEEALEMFYTNVGDVARLPAIKELAENIVKECDGLPLALKVVSGALRKEANVNVWSNFLRELRSPATSFIEDLNENVFKVLKVSYDHLKNTQNKKCLLFCGLYPEDSNIKKPELIEYWKAEGILSRKLTLEEAHDKGEAILQALIDASLLEKCDEHFDNHVKMHDVVRDLVLAMTSPEGGEESTHLVRAGISSEKMPEEAEWKKATRISFMDHDLCNLPESPDCPELLTLLLQGNKNLEVIPETFFDNMPNLRVLDLSRTSIKSLPTSLLKLDNLRELVLLGCKNLEALPVGMICRLSQIEVFKLTGGLSNESTDIVAKELSDLSSLSSLDFEFQRVENLQYFLEHSTPWKQKTLTVFGLAVGRNSGMELRREEYKRCLSYKVSGGEEMGSRLPSAIEDALNRSNCFILKGQDKLNSLSEVGAHNTYELRHCTIEECVALENIANRNGLQTGAFPNLEYLFMTVLMNLKSILCLETEEGQLLPPTPPNLNSFTNLKTLHLHCCPRIEHVFSSGFMVQQLSNLEVLQLMGCLGLKGMVPDDEKIEYEALPKLRAVRDPAKESWEGAVAWVLFGADDVVDREGKLKVYAYMYAIPVLMDILSGVGGMEGTYCN